MDEEDQASPSGEVERLLKEMAWLVQLRWLAVVGIAVTAVTATSLGLLPAPLPLLAVAAALGVFNLGLCLWLRGKAGSATPGAARPILLAQLVTDLAALSVLLHRSGGVENPFVMLFAFHMAIGAMFLSPARAWAVGLAATLLHGGSVVGESLGLLAHHPLLPGVSLHRAPAFVSGYLVAFVLMLGGTIYFVRSIADRHRRAEALQREHERIARSRERLARIGELAAGIAHTTRNPLHGLMSSVEILRRRLGSEGEVGEILSLMSEGLRRIESVTRRLLLMTRDAPLQQAPHELGGLVAETLDLVEPRARQKGIELRFERKGGPVLHLDADRLGEALMNVLDNAIQACGEGDRVTVRTWSVAVPNWCAWIEVSDTGPGIVPENVERAFDPFFTTKAIGEGSGLGLVLTRGIVEQHGGEVSLVSRVGEGTTVRIRLPWIAEREAASGDGR